MKRKIILFVSTVLFFSHLLYGCEKKADTPDPVEKLIEASQLQTFHDSRIKDKESPYTLCFENNDGTKSLYIFNSPIAYYNAEDALEMIDNTLIPVKDKVLRKEGYRLENKSSDVKCYFSKDPVKIPFLVKGKNREFAFYPDKEIAGTGIQSGVFTDLTGAARDCATYQVKNKDIRLEYIPTCAGIAVNITISARPENNRISFYLEDKDGIEYETNRDMYTVFTDTKENRKTAIVYPSFLKDFAGTINFNSKIIIEPEDGRLKYTIELDEAFLKSPHTEYPLNITPKFEVYRDAIPDSTVYSQKPDLNAYLADYAVLGYDSSWGESLHYLRFRINYIFKSYEQNVISANYVSTSLSGNGTSLRAEMKRIKNMWSSTGITWNIKYHAYDTESVTELTAPGRYSFNITEFVKSAIKDDTWNTEGYGLVMAASKDSSTMKVIATSDNALYQPYVRIDFNDLPWSFEKILTINPNTEN